MPSATDSPKARDGQGIDRREVARIVRSAALNCYGVTAVAGARFLDRLAGRLGLGLGGIRIDVDPLAVDLNVELAPGVPREQVIANVREAVMYAVQRDLGRPIVRLNVTSPTL
jgi:uncharacterized alkaline shock family protein YloU